jgi:enamine deaminase RidA (YjgF/YER057c/UK114 family)
MTAKMKVTVTDHDGRYFASTGSPWEPVVGYSRAVRAGERIYVTGTVGVEADGTYAPDAKGQARRALAIIAAAIEALGGRMTDVVRTRIYVTDVNTWREVGEAHAEAFSPIRPATTLVQVARLVDDKARVEIEADAILSSEETDFM